MTLCEVFEGEIRCTIRRAHIVMMKISISSTLCMLEHGDPGANNHEVLVDMLILVPGGEKVSSESAFLNGHLSSVYLKMILVDMC